MNSIRAIRLRLGVSQAALAAGIDCSQSNVSFYEKGQVMPPPTAKKLIEFAAGRGHVVTYDEIYADPPIVAAHPEPAPSPKQGDPAQPLARASEPRRKTQRRTTPDRRDGNDRRATPDTPGTPA